MDDPPPDGNLLLQIVLLFILILINAFFAMSEIAIISLNDSKIQKMAENGHKKAQQVLKLTSGSSNFLSTIQIGVTLAGFLTSALASQSFSVHLTSWLKHYISLPPSVINGISVVIITLLMSYFSLVLGELAPKRIGMQIPEKVSFAVVGTLLGIKKVFKPFVKFLAFSTNLIVKMCGFDPNASEGPVTEEEIRMMVDVGEEKGVIENTQKEMINNIFEFDDINAGDIMTHRTDISAVEVTQSLDDVIQLAVADGYSRIPVYVDDLDDIIGILYVKDLLPFVGSDLPEGKTLRDFMRDAYFVPETKKCGELFSEMGESHVQMAVVVDEYGGTAGIVTLEDLLESIVGNIQDEYDNEDEEISQINDNTFTIDGVTDLEEVSQIIGIELPKGEDYDTLAGFLIDILGFIPKEGEKTEVDYKNIHFTVLDVEERRIGKVRVEIRPVEEDEEDDENVGEEDKND